MSKRERIEALEARVAALEARPYHGVLCVECGYRLDDLDPSNTPGGLGDAPDNTPGGDPVPQWRASVDAARRFLTGEDPLVTVLRSLACVADDSKVTDANLARIVAVAEGQVGDRWKADPDRGGDEDTRGTWMGSVLYMLADIGGDVMWREVADICAAWLRDLTDGAS